MIELPSRFWYLKAWLRIRRDKRRLRRQLRLIEDHWDPILKTANAMGDASKIDEMKKGYEAAREEISKEQVVLETKYLLLLCSRHMIAPFGPELNEKYKVGPSGGIYLPFVERVELAARIRDARRGQVVFAVSVFGVVSILATTWNAISAQARISKLNDKVQDLQILVTALKQEVGDIRTFALKPPATNLSLPSIPTPKAQKNTVSLGKKVAE